MERRRLGWLIVAAVLGCDHSAAFRPGDYGPDGPFSPGSPTRLTFNRGVDERPAWLPDGSGIIYTFERPERLDDDRCLGVLPPAGGARAREICTRAPAADDSTNVFHSAAAAADGRLVYVRSTQPFNDFRIRAHELVLATLADPVRARVLLRFPFTDPGGRQYQGGSQVRWLDDSALVLIGEHWGCYPAPCAGSASLTGLAVLRVDLRSAAAPLPVPGTDYASSVAVAPAEGPDVIYYTLDNDTRVYRRVLSSGAVSIAEDFGSVGVARGVQLSGRKLIAVVGGSVSYVVDPVEGPVQLDSGGNLRVVDLDTGLKSVLPGGSGLYQRPAVSPDGRNLVAQSQGDLWLFAGP